MQSSSPVQLLGWAHRGVHRGLPSAPASLRADENIAPDAYENTRTALAGAAAHGADGLELDIRITADGEPVILHDATLEHFDGAHDAVADLPLSDIERRLGNVGYRLTRLQELTDIDLPAETVLEWKPATISPAMWERLVRVYDAIRGRTGVTFSSFFTEPLRWIGQTVPCRRALLWSGSGEFDDFVLAAKELQVQELHLPLKALRTLTPARLTATEMPYCVYTVNADDDWALCERFGVRAVFTDRTIPFLHWRKESGRERG